MIRGLRMMVAMVAVAGMSVAAAGDEILGKGVTLAEATSIKALYETPEKFVGKTIRIDGVVVAVCEEMGCWMALGPDAKSEESVRLKVSHDGGIVFPIKAKGKNASAQGVFERMSTTDAESKEVLAEQAAKMKVSDFSKRYQINTTGAVIK